MSEPKMLCSDDVDVTNTANATDVSVYFCCVCYDHTLASDEDYEAGESRPLCPVCGSPVLTHSWFDLIRKFPRKNP